MLTRVEVDAIIEKYDPKIVIPAHYSLNGLTTEVSGLESPDEWVNDQQKVHHTDVRRLDRADLTLNAVELKGSHRRIYYFGNRFEKQQRFDEQCRFLSRVNCHLPTNFSLMSCPKVPAS